MIQNNISAADLLSAANEKPCIVQTNQGFSVSYKGKFLYSKYNPTKAILQTINNLQLLPQTLILCISPVLNYGLQELSQKLPENCLLLGCEADLNLSTFEQENLNDYTPIKNFSFLTKDEMYNLAVILNKNDYTLNSGFLMPKPGTFKRVIKIDFSAGSQFFSNFYEELHSNIVNSIMTWWANRITLVKFGRKYSLNFFKNLSNLDKTTPIEAFFSAVEKPIVVFGAGESTDTGIEYIKTLNPKDFFILCADTALQPLLKNGIEPDGVFIEEAQSVIARCFTGTQNSSVHIFAGLSSLPSIRHIFKTEQISYFTTEYTTASFINRFEQQQILPYKNQPFGSVGLTAVYYALKFRKTTSVPIYLYGLDFSYSKGRTHAKETMAFNGRLLVQNKISTAPNYNSAFANPAVLIQGKNNSEVYTTPILLRYAKLLENLFHKEENLYDSSTFGISLNLPYKLPEALPTQATTKSCDDYLINHYSKDFSDKLHKILNTEKTELEELRNVLSGTKKIPENNLQDFITSKLTDKEYLFLHFPDGQSFTYSQSFLNRIRIEIDYFLKALN